MKRFLPLLLLLLAGCQSKNLTPAEKTAFITVADLRPWGYSNSKVPPAKWSKTDYGAGTYELDCEIETPDSEQNYPLYLTQTLSDEKKAKDAMTYLAAARGAQNLMFKTQGLKEKSLPGQTIYGDGSTLTTLHKEGISVGNSFSARKGGRTFSLIVIGPVFETPKDWDAFAGKKIRAWLDGAK